MRILTIETIILLMVIFLCGGGVGYSVGIERMNNQLQAERKEHIEDIARTQESWRRSLSLMTNRVNNALERLECK